MDMATIHLVIMHQLFIGYWVYIGNIVISFGTVMLGYPMPLQIPPLASNEVTLVTRVYNTLMLRFLMLLQMSSLACHKFTLVTRVPNTLMLRIFVSL